MESQGIRSATVCQGLNVRFWFQRTCLRVRVTSCRFAALTGQHTYRRPVLGLICCGGRHIPRCCSLTTACQKRRPWILSVLCNSIQNTLTSPLSKLHLLISKFSSVHLKKNNHSVKVSPCDGSLPKRWHPRDLGSLICCCSKLHQKLVALAGFSEMLWWEKRMGEHSRSCSEKEKWSEEEVHTPKMEKQHTKKWAGHNGRLHFKILWDLEKMEGTLFNQS